MERIEAIQEHFTAIMELLGLDLSDDSLRDTPQRVAKMYVKEIFAGLDYRNFPKITTIDNKFGSDEEICVDQITFTSFCEHHFVVFDGYASVKYIPSKKVIGLSKINRIVRFFSQRPQVQERMTVQVGEALKALLETEHVSVSLSAKHYCVKSRGVEDATSVTTTNFNSGFFKPSAIS
ncbi:GTP cyclohydrolase I type 1 [Vibrio variabilis]|uniref:GTP cyclohydrolase I n=1 Tax=Vibrio variabilis TaxID=990271 RepID=A0ABQ0JJK1_9VIBR|nr:GTP cyclohydrolase I type 1 [Vibrio variabilis]